MRVPVSADALDVQRLRMPLELELSGCQLPDKRVLGIKLGSWRSALTCRSILHTRVFYLSELCSVVDSLVHY